MIRFGQGIVFHSWIFHSQSEPLLPLLASSESDVSVSDLWGDGDFWWRTESHFRFVELEGAHRERQKKKEKDRVKKSFLHAEAISKE